MRHALTILRAVAKNTVVLDPFCGRGTTNYAAQIRGFRSYGIDSSPVAAVIAKAKLANTTFEEIMWLTEELLEETEDYEIPEGEFWDWAYHLETLLQICRLRSGLLRASDSDAVVMLRALALGCLHGPRQKDTTNPSYFSNQMPRTFASKPQYSVSYWKKHKLRPFKVDIRDPLRKKAAGVLQYRFPSASTPADILLGDSRDYLVFRRIGERINVVITSPPYYGMRTYIQDQWLRNWFLGGTSEVAYRTPDQITHSSPADFAASLSDVWDNIYNIADEGMRMVVRFGALASRKAEDYHSVLMESLERSAGLWKVYYRRRVGAANKGRRQADSMGARARSDSVEEMDYFIRLQ